MDSSLMHGEGWVRCCICGELHTAPYSKLAIDTDGSLWDVCTGDCARESGLVETFGGCSVDPTNKEKHR